MRLRLDYLSDTQLVISHLNTVSLLVVTGIGNTSVVRGFGIVFAGHWSFPWGSVH